MLPTTAMPVLMPMRAAIDGRPSRCHCACICRSRSRIASAARQAASACSSIGRGAPQKAMIASPMYLSTVPRNSRTVSLIRSKYSPSSFTSSSGASDSERVVKPAMSEKSVVISSFSPPSRASRPESSRSCTSSRGTYFPNERSEAFIRSVAAVIALTSRTRESRSESLRSVRSKRPMRSISSLMSCIASETRLDSIAPKKVATSAKSAPISTAVHACRSASAK